MSLDVIGAGVGRTGTLSLKLALEQLGFRPCYHMAEAREHPAHDEAWLALARGKTKDLDAVLKGYRASVDWPGVLFWKRMVAENPGAKVILTERNPEDWYESASNTIFARMQRFATDLAESDAPSIAPERRNHMTMVNAIVCDETFDGDLSRDHAISVFNAHNAEVRRTVPPQNLLVYRSGEGWERLCTFLQCPAPDTPYPRVNSTSKFNEAFPDRASR